MRGKVVPKDLPDDTADEYEIREPEVILLLQLQLKHSN